MSCILIVTLNKSSFFINKNLIPFFSNLMSLGLISSSILNNNRIKYAKICKFSRSAVIFSIFSKFTTVKNTKNIILLEGRSSLRNFMVIFYTIIMILLVFY